MAILRNGKSYAERLGLDNDAAVADEAVRLSQLQALLSGVAALSHTHLAAHVTDFEAALKAAVLLYLADGDTVTWFTDGAYRKALVKLKSGGGITYTSDGLEVSGVSREGHTHAELHDPVTIASGIVTITATLGGGGGQELTLEVRMHPDGGLVQMASGVGVDFGSGENQVPRGNHSHANDHPALTVQDTASLDLEINASTQELSGTVRLNASPAAGYGRIGSSASGLQVVLGEDADTAAAGNHTHPDATPSAAGLMSAEDKTKLDNLGDNLLQIDQVVTFHRADELPIGYYVGGRKRWGQSMEVVGIDVVANAPSSDCLLGLEINGSLMEYVTIPAGVGNARVAAARDFTGIYIAADEYLQIKSVSGVGSIESEPSAIEVSVLVRPSFGALDDVQINCGGDAESPFVADAYYSGGAEYTCAPDTINTAFATDPAPQGVYQTRRATTGVTGESIVYTITGLARGVDYLVRLHFADSTFDNPGDQLFNIYVAGETTESTLSYDIIDDAGGLSRAVIKEYTVRANSAGRIVITLQPLPGLAGIYSCQINGIELRPQ
jgi:hypothetical protein